MQAMKTQDSFPALLGIAFGLMLSLNSSRFVSSPDTRGLPPDSNVEKSQFQAGEEVLELIEQMAIGVQEGDSNYVFSKLRDVAVDKEGNIYLLDAGSFKIMKYDKTGKFQLSIGRKGKGPGEMLFPRKIDVDSEGNLVLFDAGNKRITIFSPKGRFLSSFGVNGLLYDGVVDESDNVYIHYRYNGKLIHKFSLKGTHLLSFADEIKPDVMALQVHLNAGDIALTNDGKIVLALIAPYTLYFYDPQGRLVDKIINKVPYDKPPHLLPGGAKITPFWTADLSSFDRFVFSLVGCADIPPDIEEKLKDPQYLQQVATGEGIESYVDVIDVKKGLIVHQKLPNLSWGSAFDDEGNYYVVYDLPFPRMVKYRVELLKDK
jgi:hypothetical protein